MSQLPGISSPPDRSASAATARAIRRPASTVDPAGVVETVAAQVDWEAALPARAGTLGWRTQGVLKRALDVLLATTGLIVLLPLFGVIALAVVLDSRGGVFYPWRVVGHRGRCFTGYKFRTMVPDADQQKDALLHLNEMSGPVFKLRRDPRVTRVGRFLRTYSLDELPELWSVLLGDMSLVGPRPLGQEEFLRCDPTLCQKLSVRPGITCLWQVSGRSEIRDFAEWVKLDKEYIHRWNLWLDLRILARTLVVVVRGTGAY